MKGKSKEFNAGRNAAYHLKDWNPNASKEWKAGYDSAFKNIDIFAEIKQEVTNAQNKG